MYNRESAAKMLEEPQSKVTSRGLFLPQQAGSVLYFWQHEKDQTKKIKNKIKET